MNKNRSKRSLAGLVSGLVCVGALLTLAPPAQGAPMNRSIQSQYNGKCLTADLKNRSVRTATCDSSTLWQGDFDNTGSLYRHLATGQCLDRSLSTGDVYIAPCSSDDYGQQWGTSPGEIGPIDGEMVIAVWNTGDVSVTYPDYVDDKRKMHFNFI